MALSFPNQFCDERLKNKAWCSMHLDFAIQILTQRANQIQRMTNQMNHYNGVNDANATKFITHSTGKRNKTPYIEYRWSRTKLDLINNKFLKRPLGGTIYTMNSDAKSEKLDKYEFILGASHSKPALDAIKQHTGIDPINGMEVPAPDDKDGWDAMSVKTKNEEIMQELINVCKKESDLLTRFGDNFKDIGMASECHSQIVIKSDGTVDLDLIDARDAIYLELDKDPFLLRSPLRGKRKWMTVNEIVAHFNDDLKPEQKKQLFAMQGEQSSMTASGTNSPTRNPYRYINGEFAIEVVSIEWISQMPMYEKISPNKYDPETPYVKSMSAESVQGNRVSIDADIAKGKYELQEKWAEVWWEAHRIGNMMDVKCQKRAFQPRKSDSPSLVSCSSYQSLLFNTVNGLRISLSELTNALDLTLNIVMYQMNKEIAKAHGTVFVYDKAGQPKTVSIKEILHSAVNNGYIEWNSSAQGNMANRDITVQHAISQLDLGVSKSFPFMLGYKQDLLQTLDRITGINNEQSGEIAASSTSGNAQMAYTASDTMTYGMFYYMGKYCEMTMQNMAETMKVTWPYYNSEKGHVILGDKKMKFLEVTQDLANDTYGYSMIDGGKEMEIRSRINTWAEASLNTKELRPQDVLDVELAETITQANGILKKAWKEILSANQQSAMINSQNMQKDRDHSEQLAIMLADKKMQNDLLMSIVKSGLVINQDVARAANEHILQSEQVAPPQAQMQPQ